MTTEEEFTNLLRSFTNWTLVKSDKEYDDIIQIFHAKRGRDAVLIKKFDLTRDFYAEYNTEVNSILALNYSRNIQSFIKAGIQTKQISNINKQFGYIIYDNFGSSNLEDLLKNYKWKVDDNNLRIFTFNLLSVIYYIHSIAFILRNLKLENIVVEIFFVSHQTKEFSFPPDSFILTDYGSIYNSAEHINDDDIDKDKCKIHFRKKLQYMPPEFINRLEVSEKLDIYSAGVLLYKLVTGHYPPFEYKYNQESGVVEYSAYENIDLFFKPEEWSGISEELLIIIKSMLSYDPMYRPSAKSLLKNDIFSCYEKPFDFSEDEQTSYY